MSLARQDAARPPLEAVHRGLGKGSTSGRPVGEAVDGGRKGATEGVRLVAVLLLALGPGRLRAQDNYEIQVYGSETVPPGRTMFELHSNFTTQGRRAVEDGLAPTWHTAHETVEITRGLTPWAEVGVYLFTSERAGQGLQWVGDHIRPRVRAPESWRLPVGLSLSGEIGYQRRQFSTDTWTLELRPIVDRQMGRWYLSLNPTLERSLRGEGASDGFTFSPNAAIGVDVSRLVNVGVEYYGSTGPLGRLAPRAEQQHQLFLVSNVKVSPDWEINAGVGQGFTAATDRRIVKLILGRRLGRGRQAGPGAGTATPAGTKPPGETGTL